VVRTRDALPNPMHREFWFLAARPDFVIGMPWQPCGGRRVRAPRWTMYVMERRRREGHSDHAPSAESRSAACTSLATLRGAAADIAVGVPSQGCAQRITDTTEPKKQKTRHLRRTRWRHTWRGHGAGRPAACGTVLQMPHGSRAASGDVHSIHHNRHRSSRLAESTPTRWPPHI